DGSSPTFTNVVINENTSNHGGGVFINGGNTRPAFYDFSIQNNTAVGSGGGVFLNYGAVSEFHNGDISGNTGYEDYNNEGWHSGGGGIMNNGTSVLIYDCTISNNTDNNTGGGVCSVGGDLTMKRVKLTGNSASTGGALYIQASITSLSHLTVANNTANSEGGGLKECCTSTINIENSIFYNNTPQEINFSNGGGGGGFVNVYYSNISGGEAAVIIPLENDSFYWGPGSIDADPLFADTANGNYSLTADSRCIDAGHPDSTDADGTRADMGAYYYDQSGQPVRVQGFVTTPTDSSEILLTWDAL
ncbi:uncharacterized protein METZ01_LOCUS372500, partial [marine metagenome]